MFEKLILVLVEAALETVPPEIQGHPSVLNEARRRGKAPDMLLLDRSYHHHAMKHLQNSYKRGRPDIVHFCLLEALGSPLNIAGLLQVYVSTQRGYVIAVNPSVRLPRVYERFKGLMEQLFAESVVKSSEGTELLRLERKTLRELVEEVGPSAKVLMGEGGRLAGMMEFRRRFVSSPRPLVMVGGFPHGDFSEETKKLADEVLSLHQRPLEAWTVVSRVLCFAEAGLEKLKPIKTTL
ncbi:MAG: 16S rRNA methyltransferase [Candidatus Caldarchaeum sp.]|nr:16S rRNA methyltransferase [Candidatus Caldarchaeum sp.]